MDIIGFSSYLMGTLAYLLLTVLLVVSGQARTQGIWLIVASMITVLWLGILTVQARYHVIPIQIIWSFEIVGIGIWLLFLQKLLQSSLASSPAIRRPLRVLRLAIYVLGSALLLHAWFASFLEQLYPSLVWVNTQFFGQSVLAVIGLVLLEQFYKNTRLDKRWHIKFLCFALGGLFAYQFYLYSDALLFEQINEDIWNARGAVVTVLVPLIAVSAARNPDWAPDVFVARGMVFYTATLLAAGIYLLLMAAVGDYIRSHGGTWGTVLQILFLVCAFLVLIILLFSGQIRARIRVFLSKNFFSYSYDYRDEWLRIIAMFSDWRSGAPMEERVIMALAQLVESPAGSLWSKNEQGVFKWRATFDSPGFQALDIPAADSLVKFIESQGWVVNLDERRQAPHKYEGLHFLPWMEDCKNLWLVVPLFHAEDLYGLVLLAKPRAPIPWNWEVIDLLKTAGLQAAGYLALEDAARQLAEARQFDGFNRLSAFVIHDLKNLIAQLSLVVRNAEKHRGNPDFMEDAIKTVSHSVEKMQRLMSQLKNTGPAVRNEKVALQPLLKEVQELRSKQMPVPVLENGSHELFVFANRDRLASALEHVIHNAQDAAGKKGAVWIRLRSDSHHAIVEVEDNGCGMDADFVRHRLFKPFETTKGLTGMGIGAYESREYIRSLGGDLVVESAVGRGSVFRFMLPSLRLP